MKRRSICHYCCDSARKLQQRNLTAMQHFANPDLTMMAIFDSAPMPHLVASTGGEIVVANADAEAAR